jgi:hypothetical protein
MYLCILSLCLCTSLFLTPLTDKYNYWNGETQCMPWKYGGWSLEYVALSNVGLKSQSPCLLRCLFAEYATVMYHGT